jgi:hypothetical protein
VFDEIVQYGDLKERNKALSFLMSGLAPMIYAAIALIVPSGKGRTIGFLPFRSGIVSSAVLKQISSKEIDVVVRYFMFAINVIRDKSIVLTNAGVQDIMRDIERHRENINAPKMVRKNVIMPPTDVDMVGKIIQVRLERLCKLVFAE